MPSCPGVLQLLSEAVHVGVEQLVRLLQLRALRNDLSGLALPRCRADGRPSARVKVVRLGFACGRVPGLVRSAVRRPSWEGPV